jgi:hypothetical protein
MYFIKYRVGLKVQLIYIYIYIYIYILIKPLDDFDRHEKNANSTFFDGD